MKKTVYTFVLVLILNSSFIIHNCEAQWTQSNGPYAGAVKSLLVSGSTIFAGVDGAGNYEGHDKAWFASGYWYAGLYISTDNGQNWSSVASNSGLGYLNVKALAEISPGIFAGTDSGVYRSTNNGVNWTETNTGITNKKINTLFAHGSNLYAGTTTGIFITTNNGSSWSAANNGLTYQYVYGFTSIGPNVYVGSNGGVFMTTNNGANWTSAGISNLYVFAIASIGNNLFAGTLGAGVYFSTNNGTNWTSINNGLLNYNIYSFGVSGTNLYAGTEGGTFFTSNNGTSWTNSGITDQFVKTICTSGGNVFSGTETGGIFKSTNNGANWAISSKGFYSGFFINTIAKDGSNLYCGSSKGVFLSTDNGFHWERRNTGFDFYGLNNLDVTGIYNKNGVLYASVWGVYYDPLPFGGGVFKSTNNGLQWINCQNTLLYNRQLFGINGLGNSIVVAMWSRGIHRSVNDGSSWGQFIMFPYHPLNFVSNGTYLFTADQMKDINYSPVGIIKFNESSSTNINGNLPSKVWFSIAVEGNTLFAGTDTGRIYKSTNLGDNWVSASNGIPGMAKVISLAINGQNIFAGTLSHGLYVSKDGGNTWATKNDGLVFPVGITAIYISGNDIFIGTTIQSVWRRTLSELLGVQNISTEVPAKFSLSQNYPNPFNSSSNLKFQTSKLGNVKISVYDVMGREVQTLVNEVLQPGTYETTFDGSMLPSGVYFYKLTAGDYSETKRLTLLK
jgi:photosystem II stability/assembly factor-like uncharacterized protein